MRNKTIDLLLVEDNPDDADLLQETLSETANPHFVITAVESLAGAFQRLAEPRFDAVLLDLGLPDSSGLETLTQTLAQAPAALPIIVLTGNDDVELSLKAVQAGAQDYLVKNWSNPELLVRTILYAIERKQVEEKLRESEDRFRTIAEATPIPLIISRASDGEILFVNSQFSHVHGLPAKELIGEPAPNLFYHPDDRQILLQKLKQEGSLQGYELLAKRLSDGSPFWVSTYVEFITYHGERAIFSAFFDITERKKAEEERQRLTEELTRSNQELEQFAYIASHDLKEPLRMVTSYLKLLKRRYREKLDSSAEEFIEFAVDGANRMERLLDDLLRYSRVGTQPKAVAPINLQSVVQQALTNLQVAIQESEAEVSCGSLPTVTGDEVQLTQLFQNLIGNAIKFSREGTRPKVSIEARPRNGEWLLSIQDNGIGIDPEFAGDIFTIFRRLHTREEYSGTGLGLAICKKIVDQHGGCIWVESEPEQGSTFYFTLPGE